MAELCTPNNYLVKLGTNTIIQITILFVILSLFFKFYVSGIIKNAAEVELTHMINQAVNQNVKSFEEAQEALNSLNMLKKEQQESLNPQLFANQINLQQELVNTFNQSSPFDKMIQYYNKPDPLVTNSNDWLFRDMFTVTGILCVLSLLIVIVSYLLCNNIDIKHMMLENVLIFTGIGIIELLFFKYIAINYAPAPPSLMITSVVDGLNKAL